MNMLSMVWVEKSKIGVTVIINLLSSHVFQFCTLLNIDQFITEYCT